MGPVYEIETRRRLAEELVDAFCEDGGVEADALAERAAGRLEHRPDWLDALAAHVAGHRRFVAVRFTRGRLDYPARRSLIAEIERFLRERPPAPGGESAPGLIRDVGRGRAGGGAATGWRVAPGAHEWPVAPLASVPELAARLELDDGQLLWLADVRGLERTVQRERLRNYRYRWIPRRGGPPRLIEAPKLRLKEVQRFILREILDAVPAHDAACGFVRGRSAIAHARRHSGQAAVLGLDLRDFFISVPAGRVFAIFASLGYPSPVAHVLTGLTTNATAHIARSALRDYDDPAGVAARFHLERRLAHSHLPQGAPTSPALANLAAFGLDRRLAALADALALRYSRYADDIALSGASLRRGARSRSVSDAVAAIARDEGFTLHRGKSRLRTAARRQTVTGVVVNAHPNLARGEYDRLRATLHRAALDGPGAVRLERSPAVDLRAHLNGRVAWAESLNPARGAKLRRLFDAIDWDAPEDPPAG